MCNAVLKQQISVIVYSLALLCTDQKRSDLLLGYLGGTLVAGFILVWAGARLAAALRAPYG